MAKTRLAKKRRLARAHAHQEQTRTHAPYDATEDRIERGRRLKRGGEVVFFDDPAGEVFGSVLDQRDSPASVGYALAPATAALSRKAEKERVAITLAELQAEVNAGGEARILATQQRRRTSSTPATMTQVAESDAIARAAEGVPTRAKCPSCGFSQKVRKDGTMSRHDVYLGSDAQQCEGTGLPWRGLGHDGGAI